MTELREYPAQPIGELKYLLNYGYEYPVEVRNWIWSTTFGTWGRIVKFANGLVLYTYPQPQPITTIEATPEEGNDMSVQWSSPSPEGSPIAISAPTLNYYHGLDYSTSDLTDEDKRKMRDQERLSAVNLEVLAIMDRDDLTHDQKRAAMVDVIVNHHWAQKFAQSQHDSALEHTRTISTSQSLQELEDRAKLRREEYRVRGLALGYFYHVFNGHKLMLLTERADPERRQDDLRLSYGATLPALWIDRQTSIDDLAKCAGLKTYDCALPMGWVRKEFLDVGKPFPIGVWSYDDNRNFGEFVPMLVMLDIIAQLLLRDGLAALGLTIEATQPSIEGSNL